MYNVYVERRTFGDMDYYAFLLEGNGVYLHKTFGVKIPEGTKLNPRKAYFEYCTTIAKYIKSLVDYGELADDTFCFFTTHAMSATYIDYFRSFGEIGSKPPKKYFSAAWDFYTMLEKFSSYKFIYKEWATKAKTYASPKYLEEEKHEKAIDAFADM